MLSLREEPYIRGSYAWILSARYYSPWGPKESDTTERLSTATLYNVILFLNL